MNVVLIADNRDKLCEADPEWSVITNSASGQRRIEAIFELLYPTDTVGKQSDPIADA